MVSELTAEQDQCVKRALEGHNFLIYGEGGTGKSHVISAICQAKASSSVQIVCSTGIACEVFNEFSKHGSSRQPTTIHSLLGIGTGNSPFDLLVNNAVKNPLVKGRLSQIDCIIWDECSMGSSRLFELFHSIAQGSRGSFKAFGGLQVIVVGDWLQLKPVAHRFDDGIVMFKSPLYRYLIPHTIRLNVLQRLGSGESNFQEFLREVRQGKCSPGAAQWVCQYLIRELPDQAKAVHLYFTNVMVEAHNANELASLQGKNEKFVALDTGNVSGLKCPVSATAVFKPGAPVVCLYNISDDLHNGTRGTFVKKISENAAMIEVGGGEHVITRVTWVNVDDQGNPIGSRFQIPLKLYWASTIHKAQGLTLDKVVLHSSFEFTGGLLYTAFSRVRSSEDIQVEDFSTDHLQNREKEISELEAALPFDEFNATCSCCSAIPATTSNHHSDPDPFRDITDDEMLNIATSMFQETQEVEESTISVPSIEEVLETVEVSDNVLSKPPDGFDFGSFIASFKGFSLNQEPTNFGLLKNAAVDTALKLLPKFTILIKLVWMKVFQLLESHLKENVSEVQFSSKDMKDFYQKSFDINRSTQFKTCLRLCFQTPGEDQPKILSPPEISLGFSIITGVVRNILNIVSLKAQEKSLDDCCSFRVKDMDSDGLGKVRFVGAWAVQKVLKRARKYVNKNLNTDNKETRVVVRKNVHKIKALESTIVVPFGIISSTSKYPETLQVTETRQFRTHGLLHVSDAYYEFSLELEQRRVEGLNSSMLKLYGENLVEELDTRLKADQKLMETWTGLFENSGVEPCIVKEIFTDVVNCYVNMGANQFLRDFRHKWRVQKTIEHRNMVMVRKDKQKKKEAKIQMKEFLDDDSPHRVRSHHKLTELIDKFGDVVICNLYTRPEIIQLCKGYGVNPKAKLNKAQLGSQLVTAIRVNQSVPYPWNLVPPSRLQVAPFQAEEGVGIKIRKKKGCSFGRPAEGSEDEFPRVFPFLLITDCPTLTDVKAGPYI